MVKLDYEAFSQAIDHFEKYFGEDFKGLPSDKNNYLYNLFKVFANVDLRILEFAPSSNKKKVMVPRHSLNKFTMLASPHYRALLKAYEIKHGPLVYSSEQHHEQSS